MGYWDGKRICVTGGAGFLGSHVVEELERRGATGIFVPRSADYDLTTHDGVTRCLDDSEPVTLWGDGTPTREFLYVEDCARGIWTPQSATRARSR